MKKLRIVPDGININFIQKRFIFFAISLVLVLGSFVLVASRGINWSIDFTGGTLVQVELQHNVSISNIRNELKAAKVGNFTIQSFGSSEKNQVLIRLSNTTSQGLAKVKKTIGSNALRYEKVQFIGPSVGNDLKKSALWSVTTALIVIMIYIWIRFEWQFGISAVVALLHDIIVTIGLFSLFHLSFSLSTVAAILTIAGYSINDTVVIFDHIRDGMKEHRTKSFIFQFNYSINNTISRTVMTSFTTLLALIALYAFGGMVIRNFVIALIFGVIIGTFSSIGLASPILYYLRPKIEVD